MSVIGQGVILGGKKGNPVVEENDVVFIDYDGTIRYSYSADDFLALTDLPPNPTHDGLVSEGWNWTLAEAKAYVEKYGFCDIGQLYHTYGGDNPTRLYFENPTGIDVNLPFYWQQDVSNGVELLLDDVSQGTVSGTGVVNKTISVGRKKHFCLSMRKANLNTTYRLGTGSQNPAMFGNTSSDDTAASAPYRSMLKEVNMGIGATLSAHCFRYTSLERISLSATTYVGYGNCFREMKKLSTVVVPRGQDIARSNQFVGSYGLNYCVFPGNYNVNPSGGYIFMQTTIKRICLAQIKRVNDAFFSMCYTIGKIVVPDTVTSINGSAFENCCALRELYFHSVTPPSISASSAFNNLPTDCVLYVPFGSLAAYLSWTNSPAKATYTYIGFATYNSGATLPTQDSTQAYNVVWYATKDDAIAQTNAISTGNGKEIYCRYTAV